MSETNIKEVCPKCLPAGADTFNISVKWCDKHVPEVNGSEDTSVPIPDGELQFSFTGESEGETNRRWAKWQHKLRKEKEKKGREKK